MNTLNIHGVCDKPTIFHITQYKCASQWVAEILKWCAYGRVVLPEEASTHFIDRELVQGLIYPTCYITRADFERTLNANTHIDAQKRFLVTRDPRDICISLYFSMKKSHAGNFTRIKRLRRVLNKLNTAEGIEAVIENEMPSIVDGFTSWLDADINGGRSQGKEDDSHHYRKGVHGDWKNHFTDELYELFLSKFEKQIVALGYDV